MPDHAKLAPRSSRAQHGGRTGGPISAGAFISYLLAVSPAAGARDSRVELARARASSPCHTLRSEAMRSRLEVASVGGERQAAGHAQHISGQKIAATAVRQHSPQGSGASTVLFGPPTAAVSTTRQELQHSSQCAFPPRIAHQITSCFCPLCVCVGRPLGTCSRPFGRYDASRTTTSTHLKPLSQIRMDLHSVSRVRCRISAQRTG